MVGLGNIDDVYQHYLVVIEENQQLKELLYNSMVYLNCHINDDGDVFVNGVSTSSFIEEIDNAIGEKKCR